MRQSAIFRSLMKGEGVNTDCGKIQTKYMYNKKKMGPGSWKKIGNPRKLGKF